MALVLVLFVVWLVGTKHYAAYAALLTQQAATSTAAGATGGSTGSNPAIQPVTPNNGSNSNDTVSPFSSILNSFYNHAMFSPEQNAYGFLPSTALGGATAAQGGPLIVAGLV